LAYEHVAEEQPTLPNEQVAEKQLTDEQVPLVYEHVADERVAELTDEQVADQQLVDVLALADAIANRRRQGY
jgi:cell division protein FtsN